MNILLLSIDVDCSSFSHGIPYIGGELLRHGHKITLTQIDVLSFIEKNIEDVAKKINSISPDIIAVSTNHLTYPMLMDLIKHIKAENPNVIIILGGAHATYTAKDTMNAFSNVDIIVMGEGEKTIVELLEKLETGDSAKNVKGIVFRENNNIVETENRACITSEEFDDLLEGLILFKKRFAREKAYCIITSRGCPYRCRFCSGYCSLGKIMRYRSAKNIVEEIKFATEEFKHNFFAFSDPTFAANKKITKNVFEGMKKEQIDIPWSCCTRLDLLNSDLQDLLVNNGIQYLYVGIESGSERILRAIDKYMTIDQIKNRLLKFTNKIKKREARATKESHSATAAFIRGLPMEKKEDLNKTYDLIQWCVQNDIATLCQQYMSMPNTALLKEYGTMNYLSPEIKYFPTVRYPMLKRYESMILKYPSIFSSFLPKLRYLNWKEVEKRYQQTIQEIKKKKGIKYDDFYIIPVIS